MNLDQVATVLTTSLSLFGLLAFLHWPYRHYRVDRFRYEIFDIRGELFQLAARGELAFEDHAYGMLRQILNGFIRLGDKLTLTSVLALILFQPEGRREEAAKQFEAEWTCAIQNLDPQARAKILELETRAHNAVMVHLALGVPVLLVLLLPLAIPMLAAWVGSVCLRLLEPLFLRVDFTGWKTGENRPAAVPALSRPLP